MYAEFKGKKGRSGRKKGSKNSINNLFKARSQQGQVRRDKLKGAVEGIGEKIGNVFKARSQAGQMRRDKVKQVGRNALTNVQMLAHDAKGRLVQSAKSGNLAKVGKVLAGSTKRKIATGAGLAALAAGGGAAAYLMNRKKGKK